LDIRLLIPPGRDFNAGDAARICQMSDIRCPMSDVGYQMSDVGYPMSDLPLAAEAPSLIKQKNWVCGKKDERAFVMNGGSRTSDIGHRTSPISTWFSQER